MGDRVSQNAMKERRRKSSLWRLRMIHQRIADGTYPNATTLAREMELSTKTIHRDLDFLRDFLQLPMCYDAARHGWHYSASVATCPLCQGIKL